MPESGGWKHIPGDDVELEEQIGGGGVALVYRGWWGNREARFLGAPTSPSRGATRMRRSAARRWR